jgi:undecaprenyl-diphosphatase
VKLIEAIILGVIQGATEFLPVSSSGHLVLFPALFGLTEPDLNLVSIAHQGTLLAVLIYFWRDLWAIIRGVVLGLLRRQPLETDEARLGWKIAAASVPAAVAGLLLKDYFEELFGEPRYAAVFLLGTALLLVVGERLRSGRKTLGQLSLLDALVVGFFQMVALLPGISRSGSTITAGLLRGLDREPAARFSFLLGVPAIAGAGLLALLDLIDAGNLASSWTLYAATFVAAAVTGYACIHFLLAWLRSHSLYLFAAYCALLGLVALAVLA